MIELIFENNEWILAFNYFRKKNKNKQTKENMLDWVLKTPLNRVLHDHDSFVHFNGVFRIKDLCWSFFRKKFNNF